MKRVYTIVRYESGIAMVLTFSEEHNFHWTGDSKQARQFKSIGHAFDVANLLNLRDFHVIPMYNPSRQSPEEKSVT